MEQYEQENSSQQELPQQHLEVGEMSVGQWLITLLVTSIPFVNIIMLIVWGFGKQNPRRNYSRANLIFVVIGFILMFIWMAFLGVMLSKVGSGG